MTEYWKDSAETGRVGGTLILGCGTMQSERRRLEVRQEKTKALARQLDQEEAELARRVEEAESDHHRFLHRGDTRSKCAMHLLP